MFRNRVEAGQELGAALKERGLTKPLLVLGIPRGGVTVAAEVARSLSAQLDVVVTRKLGMPGNPEYAAGAVDPAGTVYPNPDVEGVADTAYLTEEGARQEREIDRRYRLFKSQPRPAVTGKTVIVVDDGVATGLTTEAALSYLRTLNPARIVFAAPVMSRDSIERLRPLADDVVYLQAPRLFFAVGQFYEEFPQVEDEEVVELLRQFRDNTNS